MDEKSGTGTGKGRRGKSGSEREKAGTGKDNFSCNEKNREREKQFFPGTGRRKTIFPFPSMPRGNPNGTSCFPVRRTGTLLVPNKRQTRKRTFTPVAVHN